MTHYPYLNDVCDQDVVGLDEQRGGGGLLEAERQHRQPLRDEPHGPQDQREHEVRLGEGSDAAADQGDAEGEDAADGGGPRRRKAEV